MTIRRMESSDIDQVSSLIVEHADYEGLPIGEYEFSSQLNELIFGEPPRIYGWVVEGKDELVGYMTATIDYSTWRGASFVYLDCLYLQPSARGRKLGWQLMQQLQEFAKANGCENIQWQTPPTNELGISFYRKLKASELSKVRYTWDVN